MFLLSSLVADPSFMSIALLVLELRKFLFISKGLTRNPEIKITTIWVLPNIWRLGELRDTNFGRNVYSENLLNAAKRQGCSFYSF